MEDDLRQICLKSQPLIAGASSDFAFYEKKWKNHKGAKINEQKNK